MNLFRKIFCNWIFKYLKRFVTEAKFFANKQNIFVSCEWNLSMNTAENCCQQVSDCSREADTKTSHSDSSLRMVGEELFFIDFKKYKIS